MQDRKPCFNEDGTKGPLVDRVAVNIEDFIVGQERRSEELELEERDHYRRPSSAQVGGLIVIIEHHILSSMVRRCDDSSRAPRDGSCLV